MSLFSTTGHVYMLEVVDTPDATLRCRIKHPNSQEPVMQLLLSRRSMTRKTTAVYHPAQNVEKNKETHGEHSVHAMFFLSLTLYTYAIHSSFILFSLLYRCWPIVFGLYILSSPISLTISDKVQ